MAARVSTLDAIVVGSGPNALAAAIVLARAGRSVRVYEAQPTIGGGTRSLPLTEPGYLHDVCATVHALALESPFLKTLPLADHGLEFVQPDAPFAHPFDDGTAVVVERSVEATADSLARDGRAYRGLFAPFVRRHAELMEALLGPIGLRHPLLMAQFGIRAIRSADGLARARFDDERTRALLAGAAAHGMVPLEKLATGGYALGLMVAAHAVGWPFARGGSQRVADALAVYLRSLGGEIVAATPVESLAKLPTARAVVCDIGPRQLIRLAGDRMPGRYRRRLERYRYGPGVFKMDWALHAPVPWRAAACHRAGTIHIGGSFAEIADSERSCLHGHSALFRASCRHGGESLSFLRSLSGVTEHHFHADHRPHATAVRSPASESRSTHQGRDRCHQPRSPPLDGAWVARRAVDGRGRF